MTIIGKILVLVVAMNFSDFKKKIENPQSRLINRSKEFTLSFNHPYELTTTLWCIFCMSVGTEVITVKLDVSGQENDFVSIM